MPDKTYAEILADLRRTDLQTRNTELVEENRSLRVEAAELRRDLALANARPVLLWTVIALTILAALFAGGAWFAPVTVHHCALSNDNHARMASEDTARVGGR